MIFNGFMPWRVLFTPCFLSFKSRARARARLLILVHSCFFIAGACKEDSSELPQGTPPHCCSMYSGYVPVYVGLQTLRYTYNIMANLKYGLLLKRLRVWKMAKTLERQIKQTNKHTVKLNLGNKAWNNILFSLFNDNLEITNSVKIWILLINYLISTTLMAIYMLVLRFFELGRKSWSL